MIRIWVLFLSDDLLRRAASQEANSLDTREPVGAPVLAADAVEEKEEAVGIVFLLDFSKPSIVGSPECPPPIRLEVVA
jgi:hypothetical protein